MLDYTILRDQIRDKALELGFLSLKITKPVIADSAKVEFKEFIDKAFHGSMNYLANNQELRFNPSTIHPDTLRIICVTLPYLQQNIQEHKNRLDNEEHAYVSSYALGRDYHKVLKNKLEQLAKFINQQIAAYQMLHSYRVFTDSAPVMEVQLHQQANNGWRGKNTLLINKNYGSMVFLGELFTNLELPLDVEISSNHCGSCHKCIDICPTQAIISEYKIDARKCISYLTIENQAQIPVEYRKAIGNRIYGCDDCQLFCPWNKFAKLSSEIDFTPRHNLDCSDLVTLFAWDETIFLKNTEGSAIRRIGYNSWIRNIAVALGNAAYSKEIIYALENKLPQVNLLVAEHIEWAIEQQKNRKSFVD